MTTTTKSYGKYLMYLNTVQGTAIKTLTEALKEVLTDVNIHFDSEGLQISNMDPGQISFVSLKLHADKFEEFYCPNSLLLGVNMMALHKLLKTIGNNDTVVLYVTKERPDSLGINIQNKKKKFNNNFSYNLLDVDLVHIDTPDIDHDAQITMPCGDFQKYCRELSIISNHVTFEVSKSKVFSMKVKGKFASQSLEIEESDDSNIVIDVNENIVSENKIGTFSLKFLNLFCKSSTLCNTIQLFLKAEFPIFIIYSVASLGTVKFCLCPLGNEESDSHE
jgi:proliferating cell nuclear antigen